MGSKFRAHAVSVTVCKKTLFRASVAPLKGLPFAKVALIACASIFAHTTSAQASTAEVYHYIIKPKPNASVQAGSPVIRLVALNKRHFSSHDEILMKVLTSSDVVRVTNHELGHGGTLRKVSNGIFIGKGRVDGVPFFLKGMHVDMHYTATTAKGETVTVTAPVTF